MLGRFAPILAALVVVSWAGELFAQEEEEKDTGWFDTAELSLVATGGNTEANTFSFKNALLRAWSESELLIEAGGLRAETTNFTLRAIGPSATDFVSLEESMTELSAESYYFRTKYSHEFSELLSWFAAAGWERNEFAGISGRSSVGGGVAQRWFDNDKSKFRTDFGLFYTKEQTLDGEPDDDFVALRLALEYRRELTGTTTFDSVFALDENLDTTSDYRVDTTNSISVSMTDALALKFSFQLLFDNEPAFVLVEREFPQGVFSGDMVAVELDEIDTVTTLALVVKF